MDNRIKLLICSTVVSICTIFVDSASAEVSTYKKQVDVNISTELFNNTQIRLNQEIYDISAEIITDEHIQSHYSLDTTIAKTAAQNYTPLIPITLTTMETGAWANHKITWSSAIYSNLFDSNTDWNNIEIKSVNEATYNINLLNKYLQCSDNCTSDLHKDGDYGHTGLGNNDNDSLGPLQTLRRYIQVNGYERYDCGQSVVDLMNWQDNVVFFFHNHGSSLFRVKNSGKNNIIDNPYELVALLGVAHNSGTAYTISDDNGYAGNVWKDAKSVFNYCNQLSTGKQLEVFQDYVDKWWLSTKEEIHKGNNWYLPGQSEYDIYYDLLDKGGTNVYDYATSCNHPQLYPVKAILNYMAYEKLYTSGNGGS